VRLIPEELSIARRRLGVLVDRKHDRLNVVVASTFMHPDFPDFGQGFSERRVVDRVGIVPFTIGALPTRCAWQAPTVPSLTDLAQRRAHRC
jgi:hypothetical protein